MEASLRDYAKEMNISPQLIGDMQVVSPETVRTLSTVELERYGIVKEDPVWRETRAIEEANAWGLSRQEYMKRKQKVSDTCNWFKNPDDTACYRDIMSGRR